MVARDHPGIDAAHARGARAAAPLSGAAFVVARAALAPAASHASGAAGSRKSARSGASSPAAASARRRQASVKSARPACSSSSQSLASAASAASSAPSHGAQTELGALAGEQVAEIERRERLDHHGRLLGGVFGRVGDQRQQRLGQPRQVPPGDAGWLPKA
jgi:hypothetical protein